VQCVILFKQQKTFKIEINEKQKIQHYRKVFYKKSKFSIRVPGLEGSTLIDPVTGSRVRPLPNDVVNNAIATRRGQTGLS
jgi:ribosomal protein S17